MEEGPTNQDGPKFPSFVDKISCAALGHPGEMELHNASGSSPVAGRLSLKARRPSPSQAALYDAVMVGSNQCDAVFTDNDNLPDEQSLASALEDLTLSFKDEAANSPTNQSNAVSMNGRYMSGPVKPSSGLASGVSTLNSSLLPTIVQDDPLRLNVNSAEYMKQKPGGLVDGYQEQPQCSPLYFGNLAMNYGLQRSSNVSAIPYKPSAMPASPFRQQVYIDGRSQSYSPYQQVGSNIGWNDMDAQGYSFMQPQYIYQEIPQAAGSDIHRMQSNHHAAVRSSTKATVPPYLGTPNVHRPRQGSDDPYWNNAALQKGNSQLNGAFVNNCPCTFYPDCSCGNAESCHLQQAEKFTHPLELNCSSKSFLQHQILDKLGMRSFPEKILMRSEGVNSIRSIKSGSAINGSLDMSRNINHYGLNHLDFQTNNSMRFDRHNFLSPIESECELAPKSPQLKYNSVDEVAGRIYLLAKDQNGCRFLQRVFTEGTQEDVEKVFAEVIDHIGELMTDPFGNYLVQKLLEECNDVRRLHIIYTITKVPGELIKVSCNMHGTRAVQKVIETIKTAEQVSMVVSALSPGALVLMTDANGSHVAHRCLQKLLPEHKAFLLNAAIRYSSDLAKDRQGCCIIQKCIDHSNEEQKSRLLYNITSSTLNLSEDQYGNYVIQYILNLGIQSATAKILNELEGHYGYLSMQKCSSNVVEKCLTLAPEPMLARIIHELINDPKFLQIMLDQYGNYVIQTALHECKGSLHTDLLGAIKPHIAALRTNMFGKRVLARTCPKNKLC